jgi:murein DD-endopeptidase MepM/ murein hydrolase activator NlpD
MKIEVKRILVPLSALFLLFSGCLGTAPDQQHSPQSPTSTWANTAAPPVKPVASPTVLLTPSPEPTEPGASPTAPDRSIQICSPLEGVAVAALNQPDLLKNPFDPPPPGYDDGHFGIDLAYWADAKGKPMRGLPVRTILGGRVAGTIQNRQPYGYAVLIETPLDQFPPAMLSQLDLPTPNQVLQPAQALSCPDYTFSPPGESTSIYTIYAHLDQPPLVKMGDPVECADPLGAVGTTGRSVNPHLHLETRRGPAGMTFASMSHYDNSVSQEEMRLYCLWRISGAFAAFDPLRLFQLDQPDH